MLDLSRREFVVSSALAAALGLGAKLAVPPAFAQTSEAPRKVFYKYKVGSVEVTALYDGIWAKPHDRAFIKNASVEDTKEALAKALGAPAGMAWHDAEVQTDGAGRPFFVITGTVENRARALGVGTVHLSLSHDAGIASAMVVCEG